MEIRPEVREYMEKADFALVPVALDLGRGEEMVILLKSTRDVLTDLKDRKALVRVAWLIKPTDAGPVACLVLGAVAKGAAEFMGEGYLDPTDDDDFRLMQLCAAQSVLKAAMFDEEMELVWVAEVFWGDIEKLAAEQAADRGDELAERAVMDGVVLDFEAACGFFREQTSLDALFAVLYPDGENNV